MGNRFILSRIVGKFIDLGIVLVLAAGLPRPIGPLAAFLYTVLGDGVNWGEFRGQSLGKRIMKLQVVGFTSRQPASFRESALRNTPFAVGVFLAMLPVLGWILFLLVGLPLMAMELYFMLRVETRRRLGDEMGETEVIELPAAAVPSA